MNRNQEGLPANSFGESPLSRSVFGAVRGNGARTGRFLRLFLRRHAIDRSACEQAFARWNFVGDAYSGMSETSLKQVESDITCEGWLCASIAYDAAGRFVDPNDPRSSETKDNVSFCAAQLRSHWATSVEDVSITQFDHVPLTAHFFSSSHYPRRRSFA
jgi:hypothetical protein